MKKNNYIQIMKFIACLLITNSHCIYPETLFKIAGVSSIMQVGGGWGNTIFFAISGFLCCGSSEKFVTWIKKRYIRFVPITFIMTIILYYMSASDMSLLQFLFLPYWFCTALLIYYPVLYLIDQMPHGYIFATIVYVVGFILYYCLIYRDGMFFVEPAGWDMFKVYSGFGTFLLGGIARKKIVWLKERQGGLFITGIGISFILWFLGYALLVFKGIGYEVQFIIPVSRWIFAICVVGLAVCWNEKYPVSLKKKGIINIIANSTLEIYLVQIIVKNYMVMLNFPYNTFGFWISSIAGGIGIHYFYSFCMRVVAQKGK